MDSLYPYDFSIPHTCIESASYWFHEGKHDEHRPSYDQQHDDDSSQPCDPSDEESNDPHDGGGGSGDGGGTSGALDPPENSGELGGDEDTPQW